MIHRRGGPLLLFFAALLAALGLGTPSVDAYETVEPRDRDAPPLRVRVLLTPFENAEAAFGWAVVEVANDDVRPHRVDLALQLDGDDEYMYGTVIDGNDFAARRSLTLAPGAVQRAALPLWRVTGTANLNVSCDGSRWGSNFFWVSGHRGAGTAYDAFDVLVIGAPRDEGSWRRAFADDFARGSGYTSSSGLEERIVFRQKDELPELWADMTAVELVVIDGGLSHLEPATERLLLDYVAGGGRLLALAWRSLPEGPLHAAFQSPDTSEGAYRGGSPGLGSWVALDGAGALLESRQPGWVRSFCTGALVPWLERTPQIIRQPLPIPGLGEVPVQLFVGVILAYVIFVGPVAFAFFKRRRTPLMSFVVAPVAGLGLTAGILLWGIFGEGLSVKRAAVSLTLLDQGRHEAVTAGVQTLYAGISPGGGLRPDPGTCVLPIAGDEGGAYLEVSLDAGRRLTSSILPSRTPRTLMTVSRRLVRERLRFQKDGDGYRLLADPGLTPTGEPGSVLLCDRDGKTFALGSDGRLAPVPADQLRDAVSRLAERLPRELRKARRGGAPAVGAERRDQVRAMRQLVLSGIDPGIVAPPGTSNPQQDLLGWIQRHTRTEAQAGLLRPGTYIALVEHDPGLDDLGLETEVRLAHHLVIGTLGEDDFVDRE